jgi:hypothetical protein
MRCYNYDRFGHKSQSCRSSKCQSLNKPFKLGRKPNKIWKRKGDDKSPKTQLERKSQKRRISHIKIWRIKSTGERKKYDLSPENE